MGCWRTLSEHCKRLNATDDDAAIMRYLRLPGMLHCQTKMVLNEYCGADVALADDALALALQQARSARIASFVRATRV